MSASIFDSISDFDNDDNYSDIVYEPEEISSTRFNIVLCELYNDKIHGDGNIQGHYLVNCKYKQLHMDWILETAEFMNHEYQQLDNQYHHILFPNYKQIVLNDNYIKPEIAECVYIEPDGHCVAIIKTFWLKLIQRTWKNIIKRRKISFNNRLKLSSIYHKELKGNWPINCYPFEQLKGMLSYLQ